MKQLLSYSPVFMFCLFSFQTSAQLDESWKEKPSLSLYGFVDAFYVYDFNEPQTTQRQSFLFNHNRHNEYNLNLGLIRLGLNHSRYRANLAFQTGTYANDNYAEESGVFKNLFEANVGIALTSNQKLWLDVGIFPSHLGFESAISLDNFTLTRSLSAENSPYFLAGAKVTYQASEKLELTGLMVNGWQRIQRLEGNSLASFGTQLNYAASDQLSLNWSTFIGTDDPDARRRMRYFSNMYGQFQLAESFNLIAGFDLGAQQKMKDSSGYHIWFTPVIIGQYIIDETWSTALRVEYYQDENGVIIPTATPNGFKTTGLSVNVDYSPIPNLACRLEARWFESQDAIFETPNDNTTSNFFVGGSVAIQFMEILGK
ncbi:porin [Psychroflexus sediminis]|uniref:Putative beta-barrel porin-2, OmpL-like. bbp2 n=1 Tax=Psychroflexus sediminis TaxID=470826 RepID=A0A1G7W6L0_9FLAO|nr:porin [Psychroflexus sediminis]SDG67568.1 Putative beta-barrel porin-2, OmpL-like. bbp2 [Psychroflexus sediminis]